MKKKQPVDQVFTNLFKQINPEIKNTLTQEQIRAIKIAFGSNTWNRRHPLDLRVTIPIPGLKLYMVLLGGLETRSKERLQATKRLYTVWTPSNILFFIVFSIILLLSSYATFIFVASSLSAISDFSPAPTSIPWIFDQSQCEHTGRTWSKGKCWDQEHNPMF